MGSFDVTHGREFSDGIYVGSPALAHDYRNMIRYPRPGQAGGARWA